MINKMVPMASPFLNYVRRREGFWTLRGADERPNDRRGRLSTGFDFFCFNAHRVFVRFNFASSSVGIHLRKLSAEQQDL